MDLKVKIPENLNEITLGQYQSFLKIEDPSEEDVVKTFLNLSQDKVNRMQASDVETFSNRISSLFEAEPKHTQRFNLKGSEFGFIPDLDAITYGENKDVTSYINNWETMHKAMAVLYRPVTNKLGHKYDIEEYEGSHKLSELMKEMPLGAVMGSMVFFYNLMNDLLQAIPNFLETQIQKEALQLEDSQKLGEATKRYIHSLKETSDGLTKLLDYRFTLV